MSMDLSPENRTKAKELLGLSQRAQELLNAAEQKLGSAKNWGFFDMLGGGLISTMVKHNRIDDAMGYIRQAEPLLEKLGSELKQAAISSPGGINLGGFAQFADFFLDGIFVDVYVQNRITELQSDLREVQEKLVAVDKALNQMLSS